MANVALRMGDAALRMPDAAWRWRSGAVGREARANTPARVNPRQGETGRFMA